MRGGEQKKMARSFFDQVKYVNFWVGFKLNKCIVPVVFFLSCLVIEVRIVQLPFHDHMCMSCENVLKRIGFVTPEEIVWLLPPGNRICFL